MVMQIQPSLTRRRRDSRALFPALKRRAKLNRRYAAELRKRFSLDIP